VARGRGDLVERQLAEEPQGDDLAVRLVEQRDCAPHRIGTLGVERQRERVGRGRGRRRVERLVEPLQDPGALGRLPLDEDAERIGIAREDRRTSARSSSGVTSHARHTETRDHELHERTSDLRIRDRSR